MADSHALFCLCGVCIEWGTMESARAEPPMCHNIVPPSELVPEALGQQLSRHRARHVFVVVPAPHHILVDNPHPSLGLPARSAHIYGSSPLR